MRLSINKTACQSHLFVRPCPKTDDQNSLASSERFGKQGSNNNEKASLVRSTKLSRKCIVNLEHTNCSLAVNVLSKDQNLNSPLQKSYLLEEINENELRNKCAIDATGETQWFIDDIEGKDCQSASILNHAYESHTDILLNNTKTNPTKNMKETFHRNSINELLNCKKTAKHKYDKFNEN